MNFDDMAEMMKPKRAFIINRQSHVLESDEVSFDRQIVVKDEDHKYVIEKRVVTVTTEHIVVREFDPDANYGDAIETFLDK